MTTKIDLAAILDDIAPAFAKNAAWMDATDGFMGDNYDILRERGILTALIPTDLGGGGATHSEMCAFVRGVAKACPATGLTLAMHSHLVSAAVANDRAGRPGRPLLEKVVANNWILVSTGANDWLSSNGSARKVDGGYLVSGMKPFASGSPKGDVMVTSIAYDDPAEGPMVLHFPLSLKAEGVSTMGDWQTMGMRGTGSETIKIENAFVPDAAIAVKRPRGPYHPAFSVIVTVAMPLIMSAYSGVADAAVEIAMERAKGTDALAHIQAGEMQNLKTTADLAVADMIRLCNDFDFAPSPELARAGLVRKTICANALRDTVAKAMEVAGGSSFYRKYGLERMFRDIQGSQFHPLPEKKQQELTGRIMHGLEPVAKPELDTAKAAA
ncbi:MAG: acyl-CoA dehydrogenase [Boseongicola sp.]|nr:MAG: acyl-CoA dehydrogenase [Boseongicola sp.]